MNAIDREAIADFLTRLVNEGEHALQSEWDGNDHPCCALQVDLANRREGLLDEIEAHDNSLTSLDRGVLNLFWVHDPSLPFGIKFRIGGVDAEGIYPSTTDQLGALIQASGFGPLPTQAPQGDVADYIVPVCE